MERIRSRVDPPVTTLNKRDCWDASSHNYETCNPPTSSYTPHLEWIRDEGGKRRWVGGRMAYKAVDHVTYTADFGGSGTWYYWSGISCRNDLNWITSRCMLPISPSSVDMADWTWSTIKSKLASPASYYARHWDRCKPTMTTRANLFVFLYELRDIKRMFEIIPKRHLRSKRGYGFKDWRSALEYANGQHLNYAFGWRPFLSDVKNFRKALSSWRDRLDRFIRNQDKDLSRRASTDVQVDDTSYHVSSDNLYELKLVISAGCVYSSSFQFRYTVPNYGDTELVLRALADAFGLNPSLANIWAVIPFSFVVDWFVGVGKYLDRTTTTDWLEPDLVMLQACSSRWSKGTATHYVRLKPSGAWVNSGTFNFEHYVRTTESPAHTMIELGDLTADKIRLLASLGAQRLL